MFLRGFTQVVQIFQLCSAVYHTYALLYLLLSVDQHFDCAVRCHLMGGGLGMDTKATSSQPFYTAYIKNQLGAWLNPRLPIG